MPLSRALTRRDKPARRRAAARVTAAAAAIAALAGCAQVNAALSKQWAVVNFRPDTTVTTLLRVRASCSHVPNVIPLTVSAGSTDLNVNYSLRYRTSKASGHDLAALRTCLERFKSVSGVSFLDVSDQR